MKCVVLLSSGIDSPVAAYLLSRYIDELIFVHADNLPYSDQLETELSLDIAKHLSKKISSNTKAYIVPHGPALKTYLSLAHPRYTCLFCKRMLLRYADRIAKDQKAISLAMGDSLGQVASQTLQNITVIDDVTTFPILRPLIGFDKEEIITIAKEIDTFSRSTTEMKGCQAVPNKPATSAQIEKVRAEEKKIAIDQLVNEAVDNATINTFNKKMD